MSTAFAIQKKDQSSMPLFLVNQSTTKTPTALAAIIAKSLEHITTKKNAPSQSTPSFRSSNIIVGIAVIAVDSTKNPQQKSSAINDLLQFVPTNEREKVYTEINKMRPADNAEDNWAKLHIADHPDTLLKLLYAHLRLDVIQRTATLRSTSRLSSGTNPVSTRKINTSAQLIVSIALIATDGGKNKEEKQQQIRQLLSQLDAQVKNSIYAEICKSSPIAASETTDPSKWGDEHLVDDFNLLIKVLYKTLPLEQVSLNTPEKNLSRPTSIVHAASALLVQTASTASPLPSPSALLVQTASTASEAASTLTSPAETSNPLALTTNGTAKPATPTQSTSAASRAEKPATPTHKTAITANGSEVNSRHQQVFTPSGAGQGAFLDQKAFFAIMVAGVVALGGFYLYTRK